LFLKNLELKFTAPPCAGAVTVLKYVMV